MQAVPGCGSQHVYGKAWASIDGAFRKQGQIMIVHAPFVVKTPLRDRDQQSAAYASRRL